MSVIDSRRFRRPDMTHLSLAEFERILNTPPPDLTELEAECARVKENMRRAKERRERENAGTPE